MLGTDGSRGAERAAGPGAASSPRSAGEGAVKPQRSVPRSLPASAARRFSSTTGKFHPAATAEVAFQRLEAIPVPPPVQPSGTPGFAGEGSLPHFQLPIYCWCDSASKYFSPIYSAYTINATHHMFESKDPLRRAFLTSKLYLYITTVQSESLACKIGVFHIYNRYTIIY